MAHTSASGHDFDLLVVPLRDELLGHARYLLRGNSSACDEDIVQESMIGAWQHWTGWYPSNPDSCEKSAKSWMFQIVSNNVISWYRTGKNRSAVMQEYTVEIGLGLNGWTWTTDPSSIYRNKGDAPMSGGKKSQENDDLSQPVQDAVARLSPDRRAIIEYYYLRDNNTREISEKLGINHSTVRTKMVRAHDRLRPLLARFARENYHLGRAGIEAPREAVEEVKSEPCCVETVVGQDDSGPLLNVQDGPDLLPPG